METKVNTIKIRLTKKQVHKLSEFIEEIYKSPLDSHENAIVGQVFIFTQDKAEMKVALFKGEKVDQIYEAIHS